MQQVNDRPIGDTSIQNKNVSPGLDAINPMEMHQHDNQQQSQSFLDSIDVKNPTTAKKRYKQKHGLSGKDLFITAAAREINPGSHPSADD